MSAHTPGPWEARGVYVFGEENIVAQCLYSVADGKDTLANARLIAAAPTLLAAALDALDCITELSQQFPADERWKRCVAASATLGAAIAKAEGR